MYYVEYYNDGWVRDNFGIGFDFLSDAIARAKRQLEYFNEDMSRVVDDEGHIYYTVEWGIVEHYGTES